MKHWKWALGEIETLIINNSWHKWSTCTDVLIWPSAETHSRSGIVTKIFIQEKVQTTEDILMACEIISSIYTTYINSYHNNFKSF